MIGIIYGSSTLNTEYVSQKLLQSMGRDQARLHNVKDTQVDLIRDYRSMVFVTSTWGRGDLQDDWERFFPFLDQVDFTGKAVGLVGLGDQHNYPDNFCDSLWILHQKVLERGGTVVGHTSTEDYEFKSSRAEKDGRFVGLVIDEDNQADRTDQRIRDWVTAVLPMLSRPAEPGATA